MQPEETQKDAALRELKEETGLIASSLDFLGDIGMDTGVLSSVTPVFLGKITSQESSSIEYSKAIADTICLTQEEIKEGLAQGFLEISIKGEKKQVPH